MCSGTALLDVLTVYVYPPENGQSGQSIGYVKMRNTYASRTFTVETTFFICATLRDWERKKFSNSRLEKTGNKHCYIHLTNFAD
jgi:hypothetical protein